MGKKKPKTKEKRVKQKTIDNFHADVAAKWPTSAETSGASNAHQCIKPLRFSVTFLRFGKLLRAPPRRNDPRDPITTMENTIHQIRINLASLQIQWRPQGTRPSAS